MLDYASQSAPDLLRALERAGRAPHPYLIRAIDGRRPEMEPLLLDLFQESYDDDWDDKDDPRWFRFVHAGAILLAWRVEAALPTFADLFLDDALQDTLEWFEEDPANFGPPAVPYFAGVVATDTDRAWHYGRGLACSILTRIASRHPEVRDDVIAVFRAQLPPLEVIPTLTERDLDEMWSPIVGELGELQDAGSREQVLALFDADLVDPAYVDRDLYLEYLSGRRSSRLMEPIDLIAQYTQRYQGNLAERERERNQQAQPPSRPAEVKPHLAAPRPAAKIGRNDPCPCGSGKKYKHCHGKK